MGIVQNIVTIALRPLFDVACATAGVDSQVVAGVIRLLKKHFADPSQCLPKALARSNDRAWQALEMALDGETWWSRCKAMRASGEDRALVQQMRTYLHGVTIPELSSKAAFRQACLRELKDARRKGLLGEGRFDPARDFARFADQQRLLDTTSESIEGIARELKSDYPHLAELLPLNPLPEQSLLVVAVQYFFRREIETDRELFQGLTFGQLRHLSQGQEAGFAALHAAFAQQGRRLEELLGVTTEARDAAVAAREAAVAAREAGIAAREAGLAAHDAVLDLKAELQRQLQALGRKHEAQVQALYEPLVRLLEQLQMQGRPVRPGDSRSIRTQQDQARVKHLVSHYLSLPAEQRRSRPALLNGLGKLQYAVHDFEGAQRVFAEVATLVPDVRAKAEAHYNAYRAALDRHPHRYDEALAELWQAQALDPTRFALFPLEKYQPLRILGAGGFGVTFLCRYRPTGGLVAVKSLSPGGLDRDVAAVFQEAGTLDQLNHPAIIRLRECGFADAAKTQPYLVMDYFEGQTLEELVRSQGPLSVDDLLAVARQTAEALQIAHGKGILHRDVKPANLLVRKDHKGWQVRLIDFGLALKQSVIRDAASTGRVDQTGTGSSIAGTLDYAAPEQLGKLRGVPVRPCSDVYGFARTCCFALFQTPQPRKQHWERLSAALAELLDQCLAEQPAERPADMTAVLRRLPLPAGAAPVARPSQPVSPSSGASVPAPGGRSSSVAPRPAAASQPAGPAPAATPLPRPPLPDRAVDQACHDYVARGGLFALMADQYRLQGPMPQHPEALSGECQRLLALPLFSRTWLNPLGASARARFRSCLSALERWADFYPEYRGAFVDLWNRTAQLFSVERVGPDYFSRPEIVAKYEAEQGWPTSTPPPARREKTGRKPGYRKDETAGAPLPSARVREKEMTVGAELRPHRGNLVSTLGLLSFLFPFPLGPIAWVLGNIDLAEIEAGRMDPTGEAATRTGRLCGKISSIAFLVLFVVGLVLNVVILATAVTLTGLR